MDQGDAAVWAAGISIIGASIGAVGGYFAGRAQGRATVQGVRLQLSGQREDALWQAEIDAFAALVDGFNEARMQIGKTLTLLDASSRELRYMAPHGFGSRDDAFVAMMHCVTRCVSLENALRLRTAVPYADAATEVRKALQAVTDAVGAYASARLDRGRRADRAALRQTAYERMDVYRAALDAFVRTAQARFARPRPE
ncbi:hypothetical protein QBB34_09840 [Streptomyces stelliscabiei]|uniref:hypothetical protein n=1 Tax=Streptomyces stelliscabiei TaxID=146820 RepID=UPI002FF252BE